MATLSPWAFLPARILPYHLFEHLSLLDFIFSTL